MKKLMIGLSAFLVAGLVMGAALTANRNTLSRSGGQVSLTVYTNVHIYAGALVSINSSGKAVPASDATGDSVVGRAASEVNNVGVKDGAVINVDRGIFKWSQTGELTDANIGAVVFVKNDQTVTSSNTSYYIIAGNVVDVDDDGDVWVDTKDLGSQNSATPSTLTVSGAATVGTTLGVTGAGTFSHALAAGSLAVVTNATVGGTLGVTGIATFTAEPVGPSYNLTSSIYTGAVKVVVIGGTNHLAVVSHTTTNKIIVVQ